MFGLRPAELIIILLIVLLLFGASRLPKMARSLGQSMRILKSEAKAMHDDEPPETGPEDRADTPPPAPRQISPTPGDVTQNRSVGESERTDR
jgi:sec-independent protein translocase protein TatA